MQFALLVAKLPHIEEARVHYDTLLALNPREHNLTRALVQALRAWRLRFATAKRPARR
jgi:hypothetical protein